MDTIPPLELQIQLVSYGASLGKPPQPPNIAGYYRYDLQKLPNPSGKLRRNRTGLDKELQKEFFGFDEVEARYVDVREKVREIVEGVQLVNKENCGIVFQFGCFSGKHRSVAFVDRMSREKWQANDGWVINVKVTHRDIDKAEGPTKKEKSQNRSKDRSKKYQQQEDDF